MDGQIVIPLLDSKKGMSKMVGLSGVDGVTTGWAS